MLSSSRDALLKLFKKTYLQKCSHLIASHCTCSYIACRIYILHSTTFTSLHKNAYISFHIFKWFSRGLKSNLTENIQRTVKELLKNSQGILSFLGYFLLVFRICFSLIRIWIRIQLWIRPKIRKYDFHLILVDYCKNFPWFWMIFYYPDPDPGGQNETDPEPKHCFLRSNNYFA